MDHARNRQYASGWGRFTSADPYQASAGLGRPQSWNRYAYVGGDPANFNDPPGLIIYVTPNDPNSVDPNSALPDPSRGNDGGMEEDQSGPISSGVAQAVGFSKDEKKKIKGALKKAQDFVKSGQCDKALQSYGIRSLSELVALYGSPDDFTSLLDGRVSELTSHTEMINGVSVDITIAADLSNSKAPTAAITLEGNVYLGMLFFDPQKFGVVDSIYNDAAAGPHFDSSGRSRVWQGRRQRVSLGAAWV